MAEMHDNPQLYGDLEDAKKQLEIWKTKVEKADDAKSRLIMEKLEEDEAKEKAKQEMLALGISQDEYRNETTQSMSAVKGEILKLAKHKQDLFAILRQYQAEFDDKMAKTTKLKQKFKIYAQIPNTEMKFSTQHKEDIDDDSQPIRGIFTISQNVNILLQGGQAVITFEEEKVASQILKIPKCSVSCENTSVDVKPKRIIVDPAVKFEVHLNVSRKELKFFNVHSSMPEEKMKDRLEMSFSRPSTGGGEVERVEYDKHTGTGSITFLHLGVAEKLALRGKHYVDFGSKVNVQLGPIYKYELHKFQTFCGVLKRTIILDNIKDIEDEEDLQDHLEIHFQKPSNYGGEIDSIKYISRGYVLQAFFIEDMMKIDN